MIELAGLSKSYNKGQIKAVRNMSLSVKKGELFGFLGPNGAGKTTTIRMMVGLLRPDAGRAVIGGADVGKDPLAAKRIMGYCPDEPVLYEKMTGARFLSFIADVFSLSQEERVLAVDALADVFEMKDSLRETVSSYSHGMKQKLSLISAFMHDPEVLILDEPIVGLDPRAAFALKEMMRQRCAKGKTVFFSTHIMEIAEKLCDRVGIISRGELLAAAPLEELRRKAGETDATLEKLFLEMTNENAAAR